MLSESSLLNPEKPLFYRTVLGGKLLVLIFFYDLKNQTERRMLRNIIY